MRMRALELFNSIIRKVEKSIQRKGAITDRLFKHTTAHTEVVRTDTTVSVHLLSAIVFCSCLRTIFSPSDIISYKSLPMSLRKFLPINCIFLALVKLLRRASSLFVP